MPRASARRGESICRAGHLDTAAIGPQHAGQQRHQRRFTRAIFPQQHMHFAGPQRQADSIIGDDAGKRLGDRVQPDQGRAGGESIVGVREGSVARAGRDSAADVGGVSIGHAAIDRPAAYAAYWRHNPPAR